MPGETRVTRCGNCGAVVRPAPGQAVVQCEYCQQPTYLAPTSDVLPLTRPSAAAPTRSPERGATLHAELMSGSSSAVVGRGWRRTAGVASAEDPFAPARALWPVGAVASSTFGGSWSPSAMLGVPRVYPRYGDIGGAWAPGPRLSPVEWIELEYSGGFPVSAIRVFETNQSGSVFAVVDRTDGEELLYRGPAEAHSTACVLDVEVSPPRRIGRLRVYLTNQRGWSEIDTVALLAAEPLPPEARTVVTRSPSPGAGCVGCTPLVAGLVVAAVAVGVVCALGRGGRSPAAGAARPSVTVASGTVSASQTSVAALQARGVVWANRLVGVSSNYDDSGYAGSQALGIPDVYPKHADVPGAWASLATDAGEEWLTVAVPDSGPVAAIVWVETYNPGSVARVDDLSDSERPVILWEGSVAPPGSRAMVYELALAEPRPVTTLRIVFDSVRVAGWSEVDAVGVIPAR